MQSSERNDKRPGVQIQNSAMSIYTLSITLTRFNCFRFKYQVDLHLHFQFLNYDTVVILASRVHTLSLRLGELLTLNSTHAIKPALHINTFRFLLRDYVGEQGSRNISILELHILGLHAKFVRGNSCWPNGTQNSL